MWGVTSNAPDLMYLKPFITWVGWGPGALYISHPLHRQKGSAPCNPYTHNPLDRLRAPRRRAFTSSEKGLNSYICCAYNLSIARTLPLHTYPHSTVRLRTTTIGPIGPQAHIVRLGP